MLEQKTRYGSMYTPETQFSQGPEYSINPQADTDADADLSDATGYNEAAPSTPEKMRVTREALQNLHDELTQEAYQTMKHKNGDYATEADVFRNFRMFGGLGILVRISDKLARLRTFEERGTFSVTDESLRDTIEDAINYLVIYYAYKQEEK